MVSNLPRRATPFSGMSYGESFRGADHRILAEAQTIVSDALI